MPLRSWLFVPGDSEVKLGKAHLTGADALILDLEDSVVAANKPLARERTAAWLKAHAPRRSPGIGGAAGREAAGPGFARWVRINDLDSPLWRADLEAVIPAAPDGIMLPKAAGPDAVRQLAAELYEQESRAGLPVGSTRILPLVSETAAAALTIADYAADPHPRLTGLTWGAEDLSAALGATRKRDAAGRWTDVFRMVRAQTVLAAHAAGVMAIDTLHADFRDGAGLKEAAEAARADGFTGMLAIHPIQIAAINAAFTPSEDELARARAIVAAFGQAPAAGALQIEGSMIDRPHLRLAQRLLGIDG